MDDREQFLLAKIQTIYAEKILFRVREQYLFRKNQQFFTLMKKYNIELSLATNKNYD